MTSPDDPGPDDVAQALHAGVAPTDLVADDPAPVPPPAPALSDAPVVGGGLTVRTRGGSLLAAPDRGLQQAAVDDLAGAPARKDPTPWGPEATAEALVRLGCLDAVRTSRALAALSDRGWPVLRLHLTDRAAGLAQIVEAVRR